MNPETKNPEHAGLHRRTVVKGAAWATPAIVAASATPLYAAASPIPPEGLNGWVVLRRSCSGTPNFEIDGRGNFTGGGTNDRGFWTFVDDPNATIEGVEIVFWINRDGWTFTNQASSSGWSNLTRMNPQPTPPPASGYVAYKTTYTGTWTWHPTHKAWVADGRPRWTAYIPGGRCVQVCAYADRSITVNGNTVRFRRGPVCS